MNFHIMPKLFELVRAVDTMVFINRIAYHKAREEHDLQAGLRPPAGRMVSGGGIEPAGPTCS